MYLKDGEGIYLEEYRCGCTNVQPRRKDLPGYCPRHGESRRTNGIYRLERPIKCGLAK